MVKGGKKVKTNHPFLSEIPIINFFSAPSTCFERDKSFLDFLGRSPTPIYDGT